VASQFFLTCRANRLHQGSQQCKKDPGFHDRSELVVQPACATSNHE
jgi:hypothetical protein